MAKNNSPENDQITVNRAKYNAITIYEISEDELDIIERGSPSSNYLNFSIGLLSIFASSLITLVTVDFPPDKDRLFMIFVLVTLVAGVSGCILLFMWFRSNGSSKSIFKKIRNRKSVEKVRELTVEKDQQEETESEQSDS